LRVRVNILKRVAGLLFVLAFLANAQQRFYTYVLDLGADYVELGWGTTEGDNTIGRSSPSFGDATIEIAGRTLLSKGNQITVAQLAADRSYTYKVSIKGRQIGQGEFRTWQAKATKLTFFAIGDFGTGKAAQYLVARAMWDEFQKRAKTDSPVRFILSLGDNIYGDISGFLGGAGHTGASDRDWTTKFFAPYEPLIARVPFYPTLGNHDGNETERRGDLPAILDNFAFPQSKPGRYYKFEYADFAEFFALDSTKNSERGSSTPAYLEDSAQFHWMQSEFAKPHPMWVIPYFHHPLFTAGPLHASSLSELAHWVKLFSDAGVKVVFNGHEHNFQWSEANQQTSGINFFVSGAGGELRAGNVRGKMSQSNIRAWAPENHFLVVEIDGKTMKVTPLSSGPMHVVDSNGNPVALPMTITLP
jgi:tartrate-resistant acid phosphatase type 5